jgi:sulfite exporter TauE/SafE
MMDGLLIFLGGLLGSGHCVGMCGGFALALGSARPGLLSNLRRQLLYGLGRVFTYTAGGAAAGYAGWRLTASLRSLVNVQAWLCLAAGVLLVLQGLEAAGWFPRRRAWAGQRPCLGPAFFAALLGSTRARSVFLGGLVNGLLPCGLVYAYLALAGSSGDLVRGAATMACFGLGTVPLLVLVGGGGSLLGVAFRRRILLAAAWCVVLTGVLTVGRGVSFLRVAGQPEEPACPLCQEERGN